MFLFPLPNDSENGPPGFAQMYPTQLLLDDTKLGKSSRITAVKKSLELLQTLRQLKLLSRLLGRTITSIATGDFAQIKFPLVPPIQWRGKEQRSLLCLRK
jgi:hypothetical protein